MSAQKPSKKGRKPPRRIASKDSVLEGEKGGNKEVRRKGMVVSSSIVCNFNSRDLPYHVEVTHAL